MRISMDLVVWDISSFLTDLHGKRKEKFDQEVDMLYPTWFSTQC